MVIDSESLLTIVAPSGKVSIPGGKAKRGESAACTAIRETYEETGLKVEPVKLARIWTNGFYIFECALTEPLTLKEKGSVSQKMKTTAEVTEIVWLQTKNFDQRQWRYPLQSEWLQAYINAYND